MVKELQVVTYHDLVCHSVVKVSHMDVIDCSKASELEHKDKGGSGHSCVLDPFPLRASCMAQFCSSAVMLIDKKSASKLRLW